VWLGILELSTGKLKAANAGHEYPAIQRAGGVFEICKDKHSFIIGGMDGIRYKEYDLQINPGDSIFLYTDGVTEATDANSSLFGIDRMLAALNKAPDEKPNVILDNVKNGINSFVGDAPQFDDITMLCIRYYGRDGKTMTIPAKVENLDSVLAFVDSALEEAGCPMKAQMQLDLAVEEIFVNIAN
jgi:sigma-B regulation protein RsbU (phosphoserine phosphatase)